MRMLARLVVTITTCLAAAAPGSAQTAIDARSDIAGGTTLDWNSHFAGSQVNLSNPFSVVHNGVTVQVTTNGSNQKRVAGQSWHGGFTSGDGLIFGVSTSTMEFMFSSLVTGFGTQLWFDASGASNVTLTAFRGGSNIFSYSLQSGGGFDANNNQAQLFGLTDAVGFDRVVLTTGKPQFAINQLTIGDQLQVQVPEPITLVLLGTGLAGIAAARRRRHGLDA